MYFPSSQFHQTEATFLSFGYPLYFFSKFSAPYNCTCFVFQLHSGIHRTDLHDSQVLFLLLQQRQLQFRRRSSQVLLWTAIHWGPVPVEHVHHGARFLWERRQLQRRRRWQFGLRVRIHQTRIVQLIGWLIGEFVQCTSLIDCLIFLFTDRVSGWIIDWLIDWLNFRCPVDWVGKRCDIPREACDDYCRNSGPCYVLDSKPHCSCLTGFKGERCEKGPGRVRTLSQ